jgi:hypothetical protein
MADYQDGMMGEQRSRTECKACEGMKAEMTRYGTVCCERKGKGLVGVSF